MSLMQLCPHKANPTACPLCYQINSKLKAKQPPAQRTSLDPQIAKGKVVNVAADAVSQALIARKAAAMQAVETKVGATPALAQAAAASLPPAQPPPRRAPAITSGYQRQDVNPHAGSSRTRQRAIVEAPPEDENAGIFIEEGEIDQLEQLYPKRASIIDRQPSHPEGHVSSPGRMSSGGGRPLVTKGKRVGS
jgi:hypothetical protein